MRTLFFHETGHQHYPRDTRVSGSWEELLKDDLIASGPLACFFLRRFLRLPVVSVTSTRSPTICCILNPLSVEPMCVLVFV
ncbi:unnamed protein product [Arctogadus glacialis]